MLEESALVDCQYFDATDCGNSLDHTILAVGRGTDAALSLDNWLIENSLNTS